MKRHFYTDPLAAAWMAKHFGMRFVSAFSGKEFDGSVIVANAGSPIEAIREQQTYVIHPDSLHLLEPKVGDMVSHLGLRAWRIDSIDGAAYHHPAVGSEKIDRFTLKSDSPTIIQRDGKPFFWPEAS